MKRTTFLAALLFLTASTLHAQGPVQKEPQKPMPAVQPDDTRQSNLASQPNDATSAQAQTSAPKLGHPLDPRDVDILTGKADREARAQSPRVNSYPYDYGGLGYRTSRGLLGGWSTRMGGPFVPFVFPRRIGRPFGLIRPRWVLFP
jgi:hypothetical protein